MDNVKVFNIGIPLFAPFVEKLEEMYEKYPKSFARMNGLSEENLNLTTFINNFIEEVTLADTTIDGNANARTKDVCSLDTEMNKPHKKLLSIHKIYQLKALLCQ